MTLTVTMYVGLTAVTNVTILNESDDGADFEDGLESESDADDVNDSDDLQGNRI